jgi:pyruvate dehydrogenase E2 component (dihydrolipoamide acetyltransferase)
MEFESFNAGTLLYVGIEEGILLLLIVFSNYWSAGTDVAGITNYKAGGATSTVSAAEVKEEVETTAATGQLLKKL